MCNSTAYFTILGLILLSSFIKFLTLIAIIIRSSVVEFPVRYGMTHRAKSAFNGKAGPTIVRPRKEYVEIFCGGGSKY